MPEGACENSAAGVVTEIGYLGAISLYKVRLDGGLDAQGRGDERAARPRAIHVNDRVWLSWAADAGVVLVE